jgi:squalene-hopene/tetraprenyl-beta-curcumene cyclase
MMRWYFLFILFLFSSNLFSQPVKIDVSLRKEVEHSIQRGLQWLEKNQELDGSWGHYPAITALAVVSFLKSPQSVFDNKSVAPEKGIQFILSCQKDDGGIYVDDLAGYNTAICLLALVAADNPEYTNAIQRARDFLLSLQWDETKGYENSEPLFGGIGYGQKERPDLSNLQWAIEALKESEKYKKIPESTNKEKEFSGTGKKETVLASKELFWDNALLFIQRCQNLKSTNDRTWAGDDGGFIYSPSESKAGDYTSYGSMTYAGMKSLIYAKVQKDDKRVQAAYQWIKRHFTLEENPNMGKQGLFYYYHTMAKSLDALGEENIVDETGKSHSWRKEFLEKLISLQHGDGYWLNQNNRWWENQKTLVTAYSLISMEYALR